MRAMNRAPSSRDVWWAEHQRTCGGTFVKTREPEGYGKKGKNGGESKGKAGGKATSSGNRDLTKMLRRKVGTSSSAVASASNEKGRAEPLEELPAASKKPDPTNAELRQKILEAAERREKSGVKKTLSPLKTTKSAVKRTQKGKSPLNTTKRPHLEHEVIVVGDCDSPLPTWPKERPRESSTVIVQSDERTPETTIHVEEDAISSQQGDDRWFENMEDYRTCPVCGIGNIPAPIINLHISLCLDAEEMAQLIDDDDNT